MIEMLQTDLVHLTDDQGQNALTIAIKEASKNKNDWEPYFRPLIALLNSRMHHIEGKEETYLSAIGDDVRNNLLYNAALNSLPWYGLEKICKVNIDKMTLTDGENGLYPFMLPAIISRSDSMLKMENLTYKMLRMKPDVIKILENDMHVDDEMMWKRRRMV